jgi:type II secretory pathway pseudopilin PulG
MRIPVTRRSRDSAGSSLIEVVVVVSLLLVVLGIAFDGIVSMQRANSGASERLGNNAEASLLMDATTKDLRTAVRLQAGGSPFFIAMPNEVQFTATLNQTSAPVLIHLYIDSSQRLVETTTQPDPNSGPNYTYGQNPPTSRLVAQNVANPPATPIFVYYNGAAPPAQLVPGSGPVGLSATDLLAVHSVDVTYVVRHGTNLYENPTIFSNHVRLPNLDYNPTGSFSS